MPPVDLSYPPADIKLKTLVLWLFITTRSDIFIGLDRASLINGDPIPSNPDLDPLMTDDFRATAYQYLAMAIPGPKPGDNPLGDKFAEIRHNFALSAAGWGTTAGNGHPCNPEFRIVPAP